MASRTTYAALSELIACHNILAGQVFANTLVFEQLYASYLEAEYAPASLPLAVRLRGLRETVRKQIIESSEALLSSAGTLDLSDLVEERVRIEQQFADLMRKAGVIHDHMCVLEGHSSLDLVRARRRLEVTDQHAQGIVERVWDVIAAAYAPFLPNGPRPLFDYRHVQDVHQGTVDLESADSESSYVNIPFWMLYMPRVGACAVAHEAAHPIAEKLQSMGHLTWTTNQLLEIQSTYEVFEAASDVPLVVCEVFVDTLAALVLGPAYILGTAESIIGVRTRTATQTVRIGTLLKLHAHGAFPSGTNYHLLDQVEAAVDELRKGETEHLIQIIKIIELTLTRGIFDFILDMSDDQIEACRAAHRTAVVAAFNEAWHAVDEIASTCSGRVLKEALQDDAELRRFIEIPDPNLEMGDSWSLDWVSFRTRKHDNQEERVPYAGLGNWMRDFAPPVRSEQVNPGQTPAFYGIVLGASDACILRPHLRVRSPASFSPEPRDELRAFVERRVLIEITGVKRDDEVLPISQSLTAADWSRVCYLSEMKLKKHQRVGDFLLSLGEQARVRGISLVRAYLGLGWANVVVLLAPTHLDGWWEFRKQFLGGEAVAPEISISSIICSSCYIDPVQQDGDGPDLALQNPWRDCEPATRYVTYSESLLRAREVHRLSHFPDAMLSYGIYGAIARTESLDPKHFDDITARLYASMQSGDLSRTVSVIAHTESP